MSKTTAKDVILLCKGWYDKEHYKSLLDALKQYYRKAYSDNYEEYLNEGFLLKTVLSDAMRETARNYPDRVNVFISQYLLYGETIYGIPNKENQDYEYQMFYRIAEFFKRMQMRGDGLTEIDTQEYFVDDLQDSRSQMHRENLPWHSNRRCLVENII